VARCTIEQVMHDAGLRGVSPDRRVRTTIPDTTAERAPDLVDCKFVADAPNQLWVVDFTYVATLAGFVYVALRNRPGLASMRGGHPLTSSHALETGAWQKVRR
jgi:transposase InsO family protein